MNPRPKLEVVKTPFDKATEGSGYLIVAALWAMVIYSFPSLPDIIPIHFNSAGEADGYGDKVTIFLLPGIATILFIGMTVLNRFPHLFNYPGEVTEANAPRMYSNATRMIRVLSVAIVTVFAMITLQTIQVAKNESGSLWVWFIPVTVLVLFFIPSYFLVKSLRN